MSISTTSDIEVEPAPTPSPARPIVKPLLGAAACVALADWLLIGQPVWMRDWALSEWRIGLSLPLFLGALGLVAVACNGVYATRHVRIVMAAVFIAGLLALAEDVDLLSTTVAGMATAMFVIVMTAREPSSWQRQLLDAATLPFRGPFRLVGDALTALRHMELLTPGWLGSLVAWIVPLGVFAIFLALFSSANPLIEHRLLQIDLSALFLFLFSQRMMFWLLVLCTIWPLIHRRFKPRPVLPQPTVTEAEPDYPDFLLGDRAMLRSLVLFNALFALQTVLDLIYLWGGANLPDGMSHAEYAHRGAYPLIMTALLAAGFVLVAMRPGGPAEHSKLIRPLVLAWTAQNILLVISSIFRLDLYVAAYSLTYMRLAAFIWMVLVAIGLLLMVIQIARRKSNAWLLAANAISLAVALYGCCFINTPRLVASYNIEHSYQIAGTGPALDLEYLSSLGPQALPAMEAHQKQIPALQTMISKQGLRYRPSYRNWRGWSFRAWRLQRYLANNPDTPLNPSDSGKG
jgi:hypothetical protein